MIRSAVYSEQRLCYMHYIPYISENMRCYAETMATDGIHMCGSWGLKLFCVRSDFFIDVTLQCMQITCIRVQHGPSPYYSVSRYGWIRNEVTHFRTQWKAINRPFIYGTFPRTTKVPQHLVPRFPNHHLSLLRIFSHPVLTLSSCDFLIICPYLLHLHS